MSINDKDVEQLVDASMQYFKEVEGFSEADTKIATSIMGAVILLLWLNELPIYSPKFPTVLRVLANTLEQIQEIRKKGDNVG
jgi:hypothetical protein